MAFFRKVCGWLSAITSVVGILGAFRLVPEILRYRSYKSHFIESAEAVIIFPIEAIIFAVAWWSILKEIPSARFWGAAASIALLLTALIGYLQFSRFSWAVPVAGIAGLILFLR
jgi:hypothetical protein